MLASLLAQPESQEQKPSGSLPEFIEPKSLFFFLFNYTNTWPAHYQQGLNLFSHKLPQFR